MNPDSVTAKKSTPKAAPILSMAVLLFFGSWFLKPVEKLASITPPYFQEEAESLSCLNQHSMVQLSEEFENIMPWLSSVGAAVAAADFDNDGFIDLYVTNSGHNSFNRLFHNRGGYFKDVAPKAGVADCNRDGASMDAMFFDYDNDGDPDLYVVKWAAHNILFENQGDRTFRNVTEHAGVGYWGYANGVIAFDYNRDGFLDIFVANYFPNVLNDPETGKSFQNDLWNPVTTRVMHTTFTHAVNGGQNVLYENQGDGTFQDVTERTGLSHTGWSLDVGAGDLNNDGWPDLYVADDFGADELYFNTGASEYPPKFQKVIDSAGHPGIGHDWWKGMNVDMGDVDNNGRLDIYIANIMARKYKTDEGNMLWMNYPAPERIGRTLFRNRSAEFGTQDGGWGWCAKFGDFNNDGLLDIFSLNGFVTGKNRNNTYWFELQEMVTQKKNNAIDTKDWPVMGDKDLSGYEPSRLYMQVPIASGRPQFVDMANAAGITDLYNGRGIAVADFDSDGDLDFYVANQGAASCLYRNKLVDSNSKSHQYHWIGFHLTGAQDRQSFTNLTAPRFASSRDALGTRVELWVNGSYQMREVSYFNGFASQSEKRVHFGLGNATSIDKVIITWPSGRKEVFPGSRLAIDRYVTFEENRGFKSNS